MRLSDTIYRMMQQSRERIIETMRERIMKRVNLIMTQEEFAKENGFDDAGDAEEDYADYRNNDAPWVIFFDKWGNGRDYAALSVELEDGEHPHFKLECYNSEDGSDTFHDYDLTNLSMVNVYERMLEELGLDDEPEKVWVLTNHAATECEYLGTNNRVFKRKEDALKAFEEWKKDELMYVKRYEWDICADDPEHFEACEQGDYCANHTEGFINEYVVQ